ncbi:MAG: hypothetical protein U9Q81_17875 [Pseudomonadota bacterium]|nr:hypothetical protein [Pseudomonadota bacterium]
MKVAVVSDDFRSLSGVVEKARRFLLFEAKRGERPRLEKYFELPSNCPAYHDLLREEASFHPIDGMVVIANQAHADCLDLLERRGTHVHLTSEPDPHTAVALWLDEKLPPNPPVRLSREVPLGP